MVEDLTEGDLTLRAMSLVYTTLLFLVPLLAISFSLISSEDKSAEQIQVNALMTHVYGAIDVALAEQTVKDLFLIVPIDNS